MIPQQLIQSLQNIKGFNEEAFEAVHHLPQQITSIRINPFKIEAEKYNNFLETNFDNNIDSNVLWCSNGVYLNERPYFTHDPLFHAGAYYVQDASSMFLWTLLEQIVGNNTSKTVLDLCAAPGGKSTLLASYFKDGFIVSNEVIKQRAAILVENVTKWGAPNVVVTNNDPKDFAQLAQFFDVVVIDAPCSGSGLFRKDKEAINEWSEESVNLCCQRQKRIIADIASCINENGVLVYSTCSYSKQENEDVVDWIVGELGLTSIALQLNSSWGIVETISDEYQAFGYRFYPDKVKGEGFFIAAFKSDKTNSFVAKQHQVQLVKTTKKETEIVAQFVQITESNFLFNQKENIKLFPHKWQQQLQTVAAHLYIKKAGVELGAVKGKDFVPAHELAMSCLELNKIQSLQINKEQALQYLSKKEVNLQTDSMGWVLLKHQNIALGWIKMLPNRFNNYYPSEWRILNTNF